MPSNPSRSVPALLDQVHTWKVRHDEVRSTLREAEGHLTEMKSKAHQAQSAEVSARMRAGGGPDSRARVTHSEHLKAVEERTAAIETHAKAQADLRAAEKRFADAHAAFVEHERNRPRVTFDALAQASSGLTHARAERDRIARRLEELGTDGTGDLSATRERAEQARAAYEDALAAEALGDTDTASLKRLEDALGKATEALQSAEAAAARADGTRAGLQSRLDAMNTRVEKETARQRSLLAEHATSLHAEALTTLHDLAGHPGLKQALTKISAATALFQHAGVDAAPAKDYNPSMQIELQGFVDGFDEVHLEADQAAAETAAAQVIEAAGLAA